MGLMYVRRRKTRDDKIMSINIGLFLTDDRIQKVF